MESALTVAICKALAAENIASVRFNFRPFTDRALEPGGTACLDLSAAFEMLTAWEEIKPRSCGVVGYSAGAAAIAGQMPNLKKVKAAALISPPISAIKASGIVDDKRPKAVICGSGDKIANFNELQSITASMRRPAVFVGIHGAGHTLTGYEDEVATTAAAFMSEWLRK